MQPGVFVERRTARRAALVLTTIAVMMVACAKVSMSGALQRSTGVSNIGEAGFRLELAEEATSAPAGDTEDGGNVTPFNPATVGWNKSDWTSSDWATWIVPGPIVTAILVGFIFYMYGPAWAVGTAVVMIGVDLLAFYTNA